MTGNREIWVRRPVLWILFAYITGLILSTYTRINPLLLWIGMIVLMSGVLIYRKKALLVLLLSLVLLFGWFRGTLFYSEKSLLHPFIDQQVTIQGNIIGTPQQEIEKTYYILRVNALLIDDVVYKTNDMVRVTQYQQLEDEVVPTFHSGDILQISGVLKAPTGPKNPKGFDYKAYLARRNIHSMMTAANWNVSLIKEGNPFTPGNILAWLGDKASSALDASIGEKEGALLKAMLLGQRWLIEPDIETDFSQVGLAHILSISGMHVGYIVLLLMKISSLLRLQRWTTLIFQTVILIFYCLLVGAAPSVIRATIMAIIYFIGKAQGRRTDTINSAGVAALMILLIHPMDFLDVGFQLSFITVCSIALCYPAIHQRLSFIPSKLSSLMAVTLAAQIGTLPLTAYYFNMVSPSAVLINLIILPILGLVVMGGFILIPIGIALPGISSLTGMPIKWLCSMMIEVSSFTANVPFAYIRVISPSIIFIIIFFMVIWLLSRERPGFIKRPYKVCGIIIAVFLAGQLLVHLTSPKELSIVFLDVGQGDCTYIQTPDGKHILIDGGGREGANVGKDIVIPFLLKNGIASLDLVVMSHSHEDHISGLIPVMEEIKVKTFMEYPPGYIDSLEKTEQSGKTDLGQTNPSEEENPFYEELKAVVDNKDIDVITASRGQSYRVGNEVWLHILYPDEEVADALSQGNENNYSLVILLEYQDTSVIFTGDIEGGVEQYLSTRTQEQVDILKVPHHGSNTSSSDNFLEAISPKVGVIQVGNNMFGHPNPETLSRMDDHGIQVFRNDTQGAILCNYSDQRWDIRTMLD